MQSLREFLKSCNNISVDFDGVLVPQFFGSIIAGNLKNSNFFNKLIDYEKIGPVLDILLYGIQKLKKPIPFSHAALVLLKNKGKNLYLLTSRSQGVIPSTNVWLQKYNFDNIFRDKIFDTVKLKPKETKAEMLKRYDFDLHIDDYLETINYLVDKFPSKKFIYLDGFGAQVLRNNVLRINSWKEVIDCLNSY